MAAYASVGALCRGALLGSGTERSERRRSPAPLALAWKRERVGSGVVRQRVGGAEVAGSSRKERIVASVGPTSPGGFLSREEAGLVEMTPLEMHERFLARLTISSLNLLRVIAAEEGIPIEKLNAGLICDWFTKDQERRKEDINSAVLQWEAHPEDI